MMRSVEVLAKRRRRQSAPPVAPDDTLRILIKRRRSDPSGYQFTLQQPGATLIGGPARIEVTVTPEQIQAIRADYEDHVRLFHMSLEDGMPIKPPSEQMLTRLGENITDLLPHLARQSIVTSILRTRRRRRRLRIILEVAEDARELLRVPWEFLYLPITSGAPTDVGGVSFPLLNGDVALMRQVQGVGQHIIPVLPPTFRLQALVATPSGVEPIEIGPTRTVITHLSPEAVERVGWYEGGNTLYTLQRRLSVGQPHVLHLLCHGDRFPIGPGFRSDLLFTHRDGYPQRVNAFDLAPVLTLAPDLQIVILQACYSGTDGMVPPERIGDDERWAFESIALALVRQGIPTVVAMQGQVGQGVAGAFVRALYDELTAGHTLDQAVAAGRIAMCKEGGMLEWSLPVVYRGSGLAAPSTWYTRLADHLEVVLNDPNTQRSVRGTLIAWALLLLLVALVRWLLLPPAPVLEPALLLPAMLVWVATGVIGSAIIAAAHRETRYRSDINPDIMGDIKRAQWAGAYVGCAIGGVGGLAVLASLWSIGVLEWLPSAGQVICFGMVLCGALLWSYVTTRSQARSALAIRGAGVAPELFNLQFVLVVIVGSLMIMISPLFLLFWVFAMLPLNPVSGGIILAVMLLSFVLLFR